MLNLLRQKGLLAKRSLGGWLLLVIGLIWKGLNSASTVSWVWALFHPAQASQTPTPAGGTSALVTSTSMVPTLLFLGGVAWLTAIVFVPFLRPNIYAKMLRSSFVARHPFDDLTRSAMQHMRIPLGPSKHDFVMRIFVVNRSIWPTTIQRIEAEAQVEDEWIKLHPADVDHYADEKVEDEKLANTGLRNLVVTKIPLDDLWKTLRGEALHRGVHKEGWLAFELNIEPEKVERRKVNFRMTIIDSLDYHHPVLDVGEIEKDKKITYSENKNTK